MPAPGPSIVDEALLPMVLYSISSAGGMVMLVPCACGVHEAPPPLQWGGMGLDGMGWDGMGLDDKVRVMVKAVERT